MKLALAIGCIGGALVIATPALLGQMSGAVAIVLLFVAIGLIVGDAEHG